MARRPIAPAQFLAISFGGLIAAGTLLLLLPAAVEPGQRLSVVDAFFTSTSAVCVTGLIVVDTPTAFSTFGEVIVMSLIQTGGLGYMTISTLFALLLGRRLGLYERVVLQESLNLNSREDIARFVVSILKMTAILELTGAVVLTAWWTARFGLGRSAYLALFHSISAFNNAGFSLFPDNLVRFRGDVVVNVVITTLIIAGGLGFLVLRELWHWVALPRGRATRTLSVHTRLVLLISAALLLFGTVALFVLERTNPRTLSNAPIGESLMASYFQSVTTRTAGFNTMDVGAMLPVSSFIMMILMFLGASPGSTGGGIKTTTFGITVAALWATIRGRHETVLLRRRVAEEVVARAFFISLIAFLALNAIAVLLLMTERRELLPTLFETTSAFGTVGLSMGHPGSVLSLAGHLTVQGKLLLATTMFIGRVGPLTLAIAVVGRQERQRIRYPEAKVMIG